MNLERAITLLILLVGLVLVTVGPLRSEPEWDCAELEQLDETQLEAFLDQLIREGRELDESALRGYDAEFGLPREAIPCLRERLQERLASNPRELNLRS